MNTTALSAASSVEISYSAYNRRNTLATLKNSQS